MNFSFVCCRRRRLEGVLHIFSSFLKALLITCSLTCTLVSASAAEALVEMGTVATVCGFAITESELRAVARDRVKTAFTHGQDLSIRPETRRKALEELIEIELLARAASKKNIAVSEDYIDSIVAQNISALGSEETLLSALDSRGLNMASFRRRIAKYRMVNELLSEVMQESAYNDDGLKRYYEENRDRYRRPDSVHLHRILVKVEPSAAEDEWQKALEKAEGLLKRIRSGEDFYGIAYNNSDDEYRVKGGDIGLAHKGMITPEELNDIAFSLKPGEVSNVQRTMYGYYILKVTDRLSGEMLTFEVVKEKLSTELQKRRFEEKKAELLKIMKSECPVQILIPLDIVP